MLVSVIVSVYNCESYVKEMIDSVIDQTMQEWEMILIDDASTDGTWNIISSYDDARITIRRNNINKGLTYNLNVALSMCKGKYVIRIDGDDIACQDRFEKQVKYMEEHPSVVLSGGWMQAFGDANGIYRSALENDILKVNLLFNAIVFHPTFIIRKESLSVHKIAYNSDLRYAQDYNLEYQLAQIGDVANIPEIVTYYRVHSGQVSSEKWHAQKQCADYTRKLILRELDIFLSDKEMEYWSNFCLLDYREIALEEKECIEQIVKLIIEKNRNKRVYPQELLQHVLEQRMTEYFSSCEKAFINKNMNGMTDKYFALFNMMTEWVKIKQQGKSLETYFEQNGFHKVAIYGMGEVGEVLLRELQGSKIDVRYGIDQRASSVFSKLKIVSPREELEQVDAIVVTAISYYDEIRKQLKEKVKCPIISLENILNEKIFR